MNRFEHQFLNMPELEQVNSRSGRFYVTPEGNRYPSATTILGSMLDKSGLQAWIEAVGEREAQKVSRQAALRGTQFHSLCEKYVLNEDVDDKILMPLEKMLFKQVKTVLDNNITTIYGSECRLYSHKLKAAGSCDLISDWNKETAIVDFKTSSKPKEESDILGYFLQTTMYAYMLWEMKKIHCKKIVVIIGCDSLVKPQVFVKSPKDYIGQVIQICNDFHSKG